MKLLKFCVVLLALTMGASSLSAQEKLKFGTSVKLFPTFYLPILAADEQGIFKKNGVNAEWFPFQSGSDLHRAFAASSIKVALSGATADLLGISKGVPMKIVGELAPYDDFAVWVSTKGRVKTVDDLKDVKIGVSRLGGAEHAYGQLAAKRFGANVSFVATGGIKESIALLLTDKIDAVVLTVSNTIDLVLQNRVKSLAKVRDFLPKPWISWCITVHQDLIEKEPDTVKRVVTSIIEANRFLMNPANKPWVMAKMQEINGYSPEGAAIVYDTLDFSTSGEIEPEALKNVSSFMVGNGVIKESDVPAPDRLFTDKFIP